MIRNRVRSQVYRAREKQCGSDIFQTIEQHPNSMVEYSKHNFLQVNCNFPDGEDMERMIGWGNPALFGILNTDDVHIYVDATFSSCPLKFYQCLIIMEFDAQTEVWCSKLLYFNE